MGLATQQYVDKCVATAPNSRVWFYIAITEKHHNQRIKNYNVQLLNSDGYYWLSQSCLFDFNCFEIYVPVDPNKYIQNSIRKQLY